MKDLMSRIADARPTRLDPDAVADPAEIMAHPRPVRRGPRRRWVIALAPVAALAVALLALPGAPAPAPESSARDVLLVAAERAAATAETTGRYWVVETSTARGGVNILAGSGKGVLPVTPDTEIRLPRFAMEAMPVTVRATVAELRALPTDPGPLRAWLSDRIRESGAEPTPQALFWMAESLVLDSPVSPQVRAAAYLVLAGLDGVRSLGTVTDPLGRTGAAVAYDYAGFLGPEQIRLIVDLTTGRALMMEIWRGSALAWTHVVLSVGYENDPLPR